MYLNVAKKTPAHPFYIENKTHSALGFSSFDAKLKINFTWPHKMGTMAILHPSPCLFTDWISSAVKGFGQDCFSVAL